MTMTTFTSCNKEEQGSTEFIATMESCTDIQSKTTLNGTDLNWVAGDQIAVYGTSGNGVYSATPQTPATRATFNHVSGSNVSTPCRAYYPSTLTTDGVNITLHATQTYVAGSMQEFPMYAESSTNTLAFKNLCGALKLHLTKANTNISTIAVTATTPINGTFTVSYNGGDPVLTPTTTASVANTTVITCATAQAIDNGADFYIYLPAGNYTSLEIELNTDNNRQCIKTANTTIPVTRSHYTTITLGENDLNFNTLLPQGVLPGLFSVSATKQVRFSQGNLQYQASTGTWRFAEHQWNYVGTQTPDGGGDFGGNVSGSDNRNISATYSGWIDLFGWGTSGWNSGADCYQPWSTSRTDDYCVGRSYTNDLTGAYAEADWAWHNAISNGGNAAHLWRTLTSAEWVYLLNTRTNASAKHGTGNINGVRGLIILPDNWTLPSGCSFASGFASSYRDWTHNSYTLAQWSLMEAAGAVFLPAAGYRWGTSVAIVGYSGKYWSTTHSLSYQGSAYQMDFYSAILRAVISQGRGEGISVRPVWDNN